jgi:hypothetical protein
MCACTETDARESQNDCTLASGEGHSSRGETFHPLCLQVPFPHQLKALYNSVLNNMFCLYFVVISCSDLVQLVWMRNIHGPKRELPVPRQNAKSWIRKCKWNETTEYDSN